MDFGMFTDFHVREGMTQADAFAESFRQVEEADSLGVDSVWLAEHHFSPERSVLASPLIVASSIATRTKRIRVGLAVQVLPLTNPLRVAEEAATVDHLSKGRFNFGIGRSGLTKYYQGYNVPYSESRRRFLEALEVIIRAWTDGSLSYDGEYFSFHEVNVVPRPFQEPYPPVRVAVASEDTFSLIGSMGHPIFISANTSVPVISERLELYRKALEDGGHVGPADVALRIPAYLAETATKARNEPESSTMHAIRYGARELSAVAATEEASERLQRTATLPYEEILRTRVMYGTPEEVVERLHEYKEKLKISSVVLEMNYGGQIPYDRVLNSIRLLVDKVMPQFK